MSVNVKGRLAVGVASAAVVGGLLLAEPASASPDLRGSALPTAVSSAGVISREVVTTAASSKVISLASARQIRKLIAAAYSGAQSTYYAVGRLEMQAYSLQNSSYHGLLQEVLIFSTKDAWYMKESVRTYNASVADAVQLYERGQVALARKRLDTLIKTGLPRLRVSLALYRARVLVLAQRVDTALPRVGKPWMVNPGIADAIENGLDRTSTSYAQAWNLGK